MRNILILVLCLPIAAGAEDRLIADIQYAAPDSRALTLDLYMPPGMGNQSDQSPRPAIVFVHGGGWKNGSKKSAKKNAAWLSDHGFVVAGIDYRLTDVAGWPAQIDDCCEAVRWLRKHAGQYNIDPNRIGCFGTSAGAHLAILMGTRHTSDDEAISSRVQAVCDWFGPSELLSMPPNNVGNGRTEADVASSNGAKLLRRTVREVPELAKDASGIDHVSTDDPPFLIMHGDQDSGVPLQQSTRLHERLESAGVDSTLHVIPGAGHGGKQFHTSDAHRVVLEFFQRTLGRAWPQGTGPSATLSVAGQTAPTSWSVVRGENILWQKRLPETGQSTVTICNGRAFFTTLREVRQDETLGSDLIAWCCNSDTGKTIWTREIPAAHPLRLSGCFSDSSGPPAVTDGKHVVFFNASGRIVCFDFQGREIWGLDAMAVGRSQPFIVGDTVVFTRQRYMPDEHGHFTHEHKNAPIEMWTQLQAVDLATGHVRWTSQCGVNMGSVPMPHRLSDGRRVIVVGRGGGHSPPERPEGISMIDASNGETVWTLELPGFMSTMTHNIHGQHALVFHGDEHLWVDVETGQIDRRVTFLADVPVMRYVSDKWTLAAETLPPAKKKRAIIQQSNILVGDFHYFRSYTRPYLGRVHVTSGAVEYLQLPVQLRRRPGDDHDELLWDPSQLSEQEINTLKQTARKPPKTLPINLWAFAPNDMRNSRGHTVMGDARSQGTGWGHHASQLPTAVGKHLYVPVMNGTVYVIDWAAEKLDADSIVAINDLGPVGSSFNRASLSYSGGRLYGHTIKDVICIANSE